MVCRIGKILGDNASNRFLDCNKGVEFRTKVVNLAEKSAKLAKEISTKLNGIDCQTTVEAAKAAQILSEASSVFAVTNSFGKWSDILVAGENARKIVIGSSSSIILSGKSSSEFRTITGGALAQKNLALIEQSCKVITAVTFVFAFGFCSPLQLIIRIHAKVHPILQSLGNRFTLAMNINKGFSVLSAGAALARKGLKKEELGNGDERVNLIYTHEAAVDVLKIGEKGLALVGLIGVSVFGWQMGKIPLAVYAVAASTLGLVRVYVDSYRPPEESSAERLVQENVGQR